MAASNELRILNQIKVYPSSDCVDEATIPLTFFDVIWIGFHPIERVFFYPLPKHYSTTDFINSIVPSLTSSLSLTLHHFYPLAGKLIRHSPNTNDFAIHCKHGDSVSFTIAESLADFQALSSNHPLPFNEVRSLVPVLEKLSDDSKPLLSLQVTFFPNSGISIGIAFDHIAADGTAIGHFFRSWALSCSSSGSVPPLQPPPLFDKSLVKDPHGCCSLFLRQIFSSPNSEQGPGSSELAVLNDHVCSTFFLGSDHIQGLKTSFSSKSKDNKTPSTFTVVCAYTWVCYVKAQRYPSKERAHFLFPVDCRRRLNPPLPAAFFGNCIRPGFADEDVEKLIREDGVLVACEVIMRAIDAFKEDVLKDVQGWIEKVGTWAATGRFLSLAGSPKHGVYDRDFGWGRPTKVVTTSVQKTGGMSLSEWTDENGVEIGFVLPKSIMDEFSSIFSNGLQLLSGSD